LSELDQNQDGRIDASDPLLAQLAVWQDRDGDGRLAAGELHRLADLGIQSLPTRPQSAPLRTDHGNLIALNARLALDDGRSAELADVWLLGLHPPSDTPTLAAAGVDSADPAASLADALARYADLVDQAATGADQMLPNPVPTADPQPDLVVEALLGQLRALNPGKSPDRSPAETDQALRSLEPPMVAFDPTRVGSAVTAPLAPTALAPIHGLTG
jgi:hypothetical protein